LIALYRIFTAPSAYPTPQRESFPEMKVICVVVLAVLLAPSAALAGSSSQVAANAATQCNVLRAHVGTGAFNASFSSFATCVSKLTPLARQNVAAASVACRAQGDACVTRFVKVASSIELQSIPANLGATTSAAKACRAEKSANLPNAFGKCVSAHASATTTPSAPPSPTRTVPNPCDSSYPPAKFPMSQECMYPASS